MSSHPGGFLWIKHIKDQTDIRASLQCMLFTNLSGHILVYILLGLLTKKKKRKENKFPWCKSSFLKTIIALCNVCYI